MRDLGTSDKRLGLRAPLVVRKKEKFKMSSSLSIFRDQSAQVPRLFRNSNLLTAHEHVANSYIVPSLYIYFLSLT